MRVNSSVRLLVAGVLAIGLGACKDDDPGIANPASQYCEEQGGTLDIRETPDGSVGYCMFDDGSECEEWAYFRGECAPGGSDKTG